MSFFENTLDKKKSCHHSKSSKDVQKNYQVGNSKKLFEGIKNPFQDLPLYLSWWEKRFRYSGQKALTNTLRGFESKHYSMPSYSLNVKKEKIWFTKFILHNQNNSRIRNTKNRITDPERNKVWLSLLTFASHASLSIMLVLAMASKLDDVIKKCKKSQKYVIYIHILDLNRSFRESRGIKKDESNQRTAHV